MLDHKKTQKHQLNKANIKLIFQIFDKYQAGIIATSDGKGIKLDSNVIIIIIQKYHNCSEIDIMKLIKLCNILILKN